MASGWKTSAWGSMDEVGVENENGSLESALGKCCACGAPIGTCIGDNPILWCDCDDDPEWADNIGITCAGYYSQLYCEDGSYGSVWFESWGTFSDYSDAQGFDASEKCCDCGAPLNYCHRSGSDPRWESANGQSTCKSLTQGYKCLDGGRGPALTRPLDTISDVNGVSPTSTCCECIRRNSQEYQTLGCRTIPEWADSRGYNCDDYVAKKWCQSK